MFSDDFAFTVSRLPTSPSEESTSTCYSRSVSPCTTLAPQPQPTSAMSVTDLAAQFANQRIQRDSSICYDSCESYANTDDDAGWTIPPPDNDDSFETTSSPHKASIIQRPQSPSRRLARQLNTRMLCSSTHRRDIASLVVRMVTLEDQCLITSREPPSPSSSSHEDEGYDSGADAPLSYAHRSSSHMLHKHRATQKQHCEARTFAACVDKNVRHRGAQHHRRPRSAGSS